MVSEAETPSRSPRFPIELLEPTEMAEADRLSAAILPSGVLMERAGDAVAKAALRLLGPSGKRRAAILAGPGNNGGDGFVAARLLQEAGCAVTVAMLGSIDKLSGDAADAAARWTGEVIALSDASIEEADLIIDALFGAGLARDIEGEAATAIARANVWTDTTGRSILAVDIPSGIDGASGATRGIAVKATETVTFFRLKPGHVLMPGRVNCGMVTLADIGIERSVLDVIKPATSLNTPQLWGASYPLPRLSGHKYSRGHALAVSGPLAQTGAARLCARGALRAGAGLVTVATPVEALAVHAAALTAIMTRVADGPEGLAALLTDPRKNAVVLGPGLGLGEPTRALVLEALTPVGSSAPSRSIVLDADALTSFADDTERLFAAICAFGQTVVLTPHDGEFAKLFGTTLNIGNAKTARTRQAAALSGALIVLKGPDTVVACPDGRTAIAASEAPGLATAGSGDVLAGMITGLLAQGMPAFEACASAVWMHAEAARRFGLGLISEDIPEMLPKILQDLAADRVITG